MQEVHPNLWVGSEQDFNAISDKAKWHFVLAAKEPWHREALSYRGKSAPVDDPEYLWARRGNKLILNLVDAQDVRYIPAKLIDKAIDFISEHIKEGPVGVFCNMGLSRSPSIALLYMAKYETMSIGIFKQIYPNYEPQRGMRDLVQSRLDKNVVI